MISAVPRPTLVVVGTGMAGAKVVEEVLARAPDRFNIRMFGAEPGGTYNRILLSGVLGGKQDPSRLWLNPIEWYEQRGIGVHAGVKAERIDRKEQVVLGANGKVAEPYDYLVLATGSRPFVPPLKGSDQQGVFVFRTLEDCGSISTYGQDCESAVVIGGGLLGLEAARGLLAHGLEVTVVEVAPHLMVQQLDATAGALLKLKLEDMGVQVLTQTATAEVLGADGKVVGVRFADGTTLETDMVVISCGIRPNLEPAQSAGLNIERAIVVDDQLRTTDPAIFAVGECVQHRGKVYGLVDPVYEQARVLADVITGAKPQAAYEGSRLATVLKVMGIDLTTMGEVNASGADCEMVSHLDPARGIYKKVVVRDNELVGAVLLGAPDPNGKFLRMFKNREPLPVPAVELLTGNERDALLAGGNSAAEIAALPDDTQICNCHSVSKGAIVTTIKAGKTTVEAVGDGCKAGTGCGACQPLITQLLAACGKKQAPAAKNKIELMKDRKNGLETLPDIMRLAPNNNWAEMTEHDKQYAKWHGLFFRVPTPGHFMMRIRFHAGQSNAQQFRVIADLSDQYGKGFADLTTRQQIQLRWFTLADVEDIWRRLEAVGLNSRQTGMDNVRGICGCPLTGLSQHETLDVTPVIEDYARLVLDTKEFSNLPRKFNVTITGCLENCCHTETQDIALVPAYRELEGQQVNGFNVLIGGKQGSGGYRPASPLDVFVRPAEAGALCTEITRIFRDHGARTSRTRARMAFLVEDRGVAWFRGELQKRWPQPLMKAGVDLRKPHHADHLGIHPQKRRAKDDGPALHYVGMLVAVGRITTAQLRQVADIAERYGNGDIRVTLGQNLIVPNIPENRLGTLMDEPLFTELPYDPSPVLRGLVCCTGNDYCNMALIDTKAYAVQVAKDLEKRSEGHRLKPLTIHWSGCPAGCGLHQVATIGLQGCRSRVNGQVVDAAHVCVNGKAGPQPVVASDLMYDVPLDRLADALEPLVKYLPRT